MESQRVLGQGEIIGYSILSHDTADSCGPVVATRRGLAEFKYGSRDDFLFSPEEWDEFDNGPSFELVNKEIAKLYDSGDYEVDPDWHGKFRELVFEAAVVGLERLVRDGFFGSEDERDRIFILFALSDSETFETHEPGWVKRLNTPAVVQRNDTWRDKRLREGRRA